MKQIHTAEIQDRDGVEIYTAHIKKNGDGWMGQIQEIPEVNVKKTQGQLC